MDSRSTSAWTASSQATYLRRISENSGNLCVTEKALLANAGGSWNRLQKMLEGANIKLSGTVSDINGKSARSILEYLITGESIDSDKYDEMYEQKVIAHNLKASKEQIIDDLNGVMTPLQRRMMKELLGHLDELNIHIKNLDDEIDNFMKPEEKTGGSCYRRCHGYRPHKRTGDHICNRHGYESFSLQTHTWRHGRGLSRQQRKCRKAKIRQNQKRECVAAEHSGHMRTCCHTE